MIAFQEPLSEDNMQPITIILVEPQLGENIGMAARAMWNCGVTSLRLVNPRDGWPNPAAIHAATGAAFLLESVACYASVEEAIHDVAHLYATTARPRFMQKEVYTPRFFMTSLFPALTGHVAFLFGKESAGLSNEHISYADGVIEVPLNPAFPSLNLAQAVYAICYEYRLLTGGEGSLLKPLDTPATKKDLLGLFEHLENELDQSGFLLPLHKREAMILNIRNSLARASLTEQEVRTWRGIIRSLTQNRKNAPSEN